MLIGIGPDITAVPGYNCTDQLTIRDTNTLSLMQHSTRNKFSAAVCTAAQLLYLLCTTFGTAVTQYSCTSLSTIKAEFSKVGGILNNKNILKRC